MFIIIEMQTTGSTTAIVPAQTHTDENQAEHAYHTALAAAAISTFDIHAVSMLDEYGNILKRDYYIHKTEEPEPEEADAE